MYVNPYIMNCLFYIIIRETYTHYVVTLMPGTEKIITIHNQNISSTKFLYALYKNKLHVFIQTSLFLQNLLIQNIKKNVCMKQFKNQKWQKTDNFKESW